ncbi:hypothetical protein J1605_022983 [Eschrichtius robustus]|uniref:Uncharacterized protein n=1 Tax=Eschrichtius robustus TaxID=9764 RepID=A0AB34H7Z8_ESCRO|nr:hypothetical protein J1605_022983 [Eschrichtius robustus]
MSVLDEFTTSPAVRMEFHSREPDSGQQQDLQNVFSAEALPETEDKSRLSTNTRKTPKAEEVVASESFSELTVRAQLGAKSEELLKKGKSISDMLLVSIMVNAINNFHNIAEAFSSETPHEDINQRVAAKNQDVDEDQNLRDQIQHRLV